jgi:hypothetical protein
LNFGNLNLGNPDGYQKKGVAREAKRIVVKRSGLAKRDIEWTRKQGIVLEKQNEAGPRISQGMVAWGMGGCQYLFITVLYSKQMMHRND